MNEHITDIHHKLDMLDAKLQNTATLIQKSLCMSQEHHKFLKHGLEGYIRSVKLKKEVDFSQKLYHRIRRDIGALKFPHRKILDFMIENYDYQNNTFREFTYSELIKKCRLGKNRATEYFQFLIDRGYLTRRSDGYRTWYKIKYEEDENE